MKQTNCCSHQENSKAAKCSTCTLLSGSAHLYISVILFLFLMVTCRRYSFTVGCDTEAAVRYWM